ncbi:MAG: hypothetical protein ACI85N_001925 [Gammaproteobacteria bacterium]|jgi:hypothetical protein
MSLVREKIKELSPSVFLLYAQLLEQIAHPLPALEDATYMRKERNGKAYWIRRVKIGNTSMDLGLGRETEKLLKAIEQDKVIANELKDEVKVRENLINMLISGGLNKLDPLSNRVLSLLESAGVFAAGGVLVGSHAFNVYGNMMGYQFPFETTQTADIDLSISIGISKKTINLKKAIMDSNLGFSEIPALNRKSPSTSYKIRNSELKVDLLTPLSGKESSKPVFMPALKLHATPLRFLDYLLKEPIQAVIASGRGILVNVPQPARFAIHKLVLSQRRTITQQIKVIKDLRQAASLIEILSLDRPNDIEAALVDANNSKSEKFKKQMLLGFESVCDKGFLSTEAISLFKATWEKVGGEDDYLKI